MNLEDVRLFALSLSPVVEEELFVENWIDWRVGGKWFLLMQLDAPEPRVAVKLPPAVGEDFRMRLEGVRPAFHMNKTHWSDLYLNLLPDDFIREQIRRSFLLVASSLPRTKRRDLGLDTII